MGMDGSSSLDGLRMWLLFVVMEGMFNCKNVASVPTVQEDPGS